MVTGVEHPAPRANGMADRFRRVGSRTVVPAGGLAVCGRGSPPSGSGVPAAGPLIILSPIGEGQLAAGVIRSQRKLRAGRSLGQDHLFGGVLSVMQGSVGHRWAYAVWRKERDARPRPLPKGRIAKQARLLAVSPRTPTLASELLSNFPEVMLHSASLPRRSVRYALADLVLLMPKSPKSLREPEPSRRRQKSVSKVAYLPGTDGSNPFPSSGESTNRHKE